MGSRDCTNKATKAGVARNVKKPLFRYHSRGAASDQRTTPQFQTANLFGLHFNVQ
jgi:hypothetical protein